MYLHHCQTYQRNFLCRILDFSALRLECWEKNEKVSLQCRRRLVSFVYIWGQRGREAPRRIAEGFEERS